MKEISKTQFTSHSWRARLFRGSMATCGYFVGLEAMTAELSWSGFLHMLMPQTVLGLIIAVGAAISTEGPVRK